MAEYGIDRDFNLRLSKHAPSQKRGTAATKPLPSIDGLYLAMPLLLGVVGGLGFDRLFGTRPWGTLLFLVAGTVSSFYNVFVLIRSTRNTAR